MKRWVHAAESEYSDLIPVRRIVVTVYYTNPNGSIYSTDVLPLRNPDGSFDELALDYYNEFVINALEVFEEHDLEIVEEHESPRSMSNYFTLVKKEDLENADYKYLLFIRLSDHDNRRESKKATKEYYNNRAQELKQPPAKTYQKWKLKEITVNNKRFSTYEEALEEIDKRLSTI